MKAIGPLIVGASSAPGGTANTSLLVVAPFADQYTWGQVGIVSTSPQAIDRGGAMLFGGVYDGAGNVAPWGRISAGKTNSVSGEYGGYLALWTRPNAGNLLERLRITELGEVRIPGAIAQGASPATTGDIRLSANAAINAAATQMTMAVAGASVFYVQPNQIVLENSTNIFVGNGVGSKFATFATAKMGWWGATPVVQNTGWAATAGYTADKAFNPQTTTLAELANVVGTLIDTLKTYGLLGA